MAKHESVLIESDSMVNRMLDHMTDEEIASVTGFALDEDGCVVVNPGVWSVGWPDHVTTPRYNSDANYHGVAYDTVDEVPVAVRHTICR